MKYNCWLYYEGITQLVVGNLRVRCKGSRNGKINKNTQKEICITKIKTVLVQLETRYNLIWIGIKYKFTSFEQRKVSVSKRIYCIYMDPIVSEWQVPALKGLPADAPNV